MALINPTPEGSVDTQDVSGRLAGTSGGWRNFFVAVFNICNALTSSGTTAQRPTTFLFVGRTYFDTDLGYQIWVQSTNPTVWVTANGAVPPWTGGITLDTKKFTTSGSSWTFTGIPAGVKRITVMLVGFSTNGTSNWTLRLGDAGGVENSGYSAVSFTVGNAGTPSVIASTAGFIVGSLSAVNLGYITFTLNLVTADTFTWNCVQGGYIDAGGTPFVVGGGGSKSLSAELTQVQLTTVNGTDAGDAGIVGLSYE
jgi:hypothetical protein